MNSAARTRFKSETVVDGGTVIVVAAEGSPSNNADNRNEAIFAQLCDRRRKRCGQSSVGSSLNILFPPRSEVGLATVAYQMRNLILENEAHAFHPFRDFSHPKTG